MTINPNIFKAYDIRGIYPHEINEEVAYRVGRAFVNFTNAQVVVVGRDCRLSSNSLFESLKNGLLKEGVDVIDIGPCSSPVFYFAVGEYDLYDGGIMITASHNPKEYNGLKLVRNNALPIGGVSGMEKIKEMVLKNVWKDKQQGNVIETEMLDAYVEKILSFVNLWTSEVKTNSNVKKSKKFKVVVDAGNGMGGLSLQMMSKVLKSDFNTQIIPIYFEPDGNFPNHEANPTKPENLNDLRREIIKQKADFGIALDGDGDRIAVVDEKGEVVRGDYLTPIFAKIILEKYKGARILYDVRCSNIVPETIKELGGIPEMTPVGHANIKKIMADGDAVFGGEFSNHFYFRDFYFAESPDLCLLLLLQYLTSLHYENKGGLTPSHPPYIRGDKGGLKMSEAILPLKKYFHSGEINFEVKDKEGIIKKIEEKYISNAKKVIRIDGLRLDFNEWWFNVRLSNTEPLLRLNLEAKSQELMEAKKEELSNFIKNL
jgi:phosphomannomutase